MLRRSLLPESEVVGAAEDFDLVYGLMQTIEKAASIMLNVITTGKEIQSRMTDNDLREAAALFNLKINEDFLDE